MNKLGQLPSELISLILDHVDQRDLHALTLINKPFYKQAMPLLWRNLTINSQDILRNIITITTTCPLFPGNFIQSVTINTILSDDELLAFMQHIPPQLQHLNLYGAHNISDTSFQQVPAHCPCLVTLAISHAKITQASMVALGQHCRRLSKLTLTFCYGVDIDLFGALQGCPLTDINITRCHLDGMKDTSLAKQTALTMAGFSGLTSLHIQDHTNNYTPLLSTHWPCLTHLYLDACDDLDDTTAIQFLQAHPRLTYLELRTSNHMTDRTLDAIPLYLPEIKDVRLHSIPRLTAAGVCRLVQRCATLEQGVRFTGCYIYPHQGDLRDVDYRFYRTALNQEIGAREVVWLLPQAFDVPMVKG